MELYYFKADLKNDAPGLYRDLSHSFSKEDLLLLAKTYNASCLADGLNESPLIKEEGVTFNPKPARICSIILKENKTIDLALFQTALLISSDFNSIMDSSLIKVIDYCRKINILDSKFNLDKSNLIETVFLAKHLDYLRHFHIYNNEKSKFHYLCELNLQSIIPYIKFDNNSKIRDMILFWTNRFMKKYNL